MPYLTPIELGSFRFQPKLILSLLVAGLLGLFLSLGTWQLSRASEKRNLLQTLNTHTREGITDLPTNVQNFEHWRHRKVRVTGRFDHNHQFLLDNQIRRGRVGVQVLTPLRIANKDRAVLVERGWLPMGPDRAKLPAVAVETELTSLVGTVYVPYKEGLRLGPIDAQQESWPRLVQYMDFEEMSDRLGYALLPLTIRLDPNHPQGYLREWASIPLFTPDRHIAYAIQWYSLAAVVLVIYLALSFKRITTLTPNDD